MKVDKKRTEVPELDISPMIDCVFQLIMFFMVIIALVVVIGIAIKFPKTPPGGAKKSKDKILFAYVERDVIDAQHNIIRDGSIKISGKEIILSTARDSTKREEQYKRSFVKIRKEMRRLIKEEGYKKDQIVISGDVTSYHWKIIKIIDLAKKEKVSAFSLMPPR